MAKLDQTEYQLFQRRVNGRPLIRELNLGYREMVAGLPTWLPSLARAEGCQHAHAPALILPKYFKLTTLSYLEPTLRVLMLKGRAGARSLLNRDQTLLGIALLSDLAVMSPNDQALDFCAAGSYV